VDKERFGPKSREFALANIAFYYFIERFGEIYDVTLPKTKQVIETMERFNEMKDEMFPRMDIKNSDYGESEGFLERIPMGFPVRRSGSYSYPGSIRKLGENVIPKLRELGFDDKFIENIHEAARLFCVELIKSKPPEYTKDGKRIIVHKYKR